MNPVRSPSRAFLNPLGYPNQLSNTIQQKSMSGSSSGCMARVCSIRSSMSHGPLRPCLSLFALLPLSTSTSEQKGRELPVWSLGSPGRADAASWRLSRGGDPSLLLGTVSRSRARLTFLSFCFDVDVDVSSAVVSVAVYVVLRLWPYGFSSQPYGFCPSAVWFLSVP